MGVIGEIRRDAPISKSDTPKLPRWYCAIEDFVPFPTPVPAKVYGKHFEKLASNGCTGVRVISDQTFKEILQAAGIEPLNIPKEEVNGKDAAIFPPISEVRPTEVAGGLLMPRRFARGFVLCAAGGAKKTFRQVGDRAEQIVLNHLRSKLGQTVAVRHVAADGQTSGWDIDYNGPDGHCAPLRLKPRPVEHFSTSS